MAVEPVWMTWRRENSWSYRNSNSEPFRRRTRSQSLYGPCYPVSTLIDNNNVKWIVQDVEGNWQMLQRSDCSLFRASLFDPEVGGDTLLRNIGSIRNSLCKNPVIFTAMTTSNPVQSGVLEHGLAVRETEITNLAFVLHTPRNNLWTIQSQDSSFHVFRIHRSQLAANSTYMASASGKVSFHRLSNNTQALDAGSNWPWLEHLTQPTNSHKHFKFCSCSLLCSRFAEIVPFPYIKSPWNSQ
jgi:hypothetical protein